MPEGEASHFAFPAGSTQELLSEDIDPGDILALESRPVAHQRLSAGRVRRELSNREVPDRANSDEANHAEESGGGTRHLLDQSSWRSPTHFDERRLKSAVDTFFPTMYECRRRW
jgi:hypothetical protein